MAMVVSVSVITVLFPSVDVFFQEVGKDCGIVSFRKLLFCICLDFGKNFLNSKTAIEIVLIK